MIKAFSRPSRKILTICIVAIISLFQFFNFSARADVLQNRDSQETNYHSELMIAFDTSGSISNESLRQTIDKIDRILKSDDFRYAVDSFANQKIRLVFIVFDEAFGVIFDEIITYDTKIDYVEILSKMKSASNGTSHQSSLAYFLTQHGRDLLGLDGAVQQRHIVFVTDEIPILPEFKEQIAQLYDLESASYVRILSQHDWISTDVEAWKMRAQAMVDLAGGKSAYAVEDDDLKRLLVLAVSYEGL